MIILGFFVDHFSLLNSLCRLFCLFLFIVFIILVFITHFCPYGVNDGKTHEQDVVVVLLPASRGQTVVFVSKNLKESVVETGTTSEKYYVWIFI